MAGKSFEHKAKDRWQAREKRVLQERTLGVVRAAKTLHEEHQAAQNPQNTQNTWSTCTIDTNLGTDGLGITTSTASSNNVCLNVAAVAWWTTAEPEKAPEDKRALAESTRLERFLGAPEIDHHYQAILERRIKKRASKQTRFKSMFADDLEQPKP